VPEPINDLAERRNVIVLGIETSGPKGGVALLTERGCEERRFDTQRSLGAELAPAIQDLLDKAGLGPANPPDLVAVDLGPGSYTGLRVGLAAAKGLAFAWGRPLIGVRLVDALARQAPPARRVVCAVDAQRGEVWHCVLERRGPTAELVQEARISEFDFLAQALAEDAIVIGDAAHTVERALAGRSLRVAPGELAWPQPRLVAELGRERHLRGEREDAIALSPVYLRANEAEERRRKRARSEP
jgi:tRNA threonylcarbamoyladenosine biosynthesis protein TsaB